jgi:hypothetical protein
MRHTLAKFDVCPSLAALLCWGVDVWMSCRFDECGHMRPFNSLSVRRTLSIAALSSVSISHAVDDLGCPNASEDGQSHVHDGGGCADGDFAGLSATEPRARALPRPQAKEHGRHGAHATGLDAPVKPHLVRCLLCTLIVASTQRSRVRDETTGGCTATRSTTFSRCCPCASLARSRPLR